MSPFYSLTNTEKADDKKNTIKKAPDYINHEMQNKSTLFHYNYTYVHTVLVVICFFPSTFNSHTSRVRQGLSSAII